MSNKLIIYIIGTYPLLTTTFIDREIMRLIELGVNLQIFSIRRPPRRSPLSSFQYNLQKRVTYLLPIRITALIFSHLYFSLLRPQRYFGSMVYLLSRPHPDFSSRIMTLLHFGEGVYFAYLIRKKNIYEIHAHFLDRVAVLAMVAKRLLGVPYSLSIHAGADIYVHPVLIQEKLLDSRHAVTCTRHNINHLESLVGNSIREKISYVPHGLNAANYKPEKKKNGAQIILAVGQLKRRKGFLQIIEVCKTLNEQGYEFQCEIIGDGPIYDILQEKILNYSLGEKVALRGALPFENVMECYRRATLFVMPCMQSEDGDVDGIPNVLLEAMAMKIPVISTKVSAIPELIIDQKNGLLVSPNNHDDLFDAIVNLLNSSEKRAILAENGRETIKSEFNIERNIDKFVQTLWPKLITERLD